MGIRGIIGFAFALNVLLANVCLAGSAYAATPGSGATQELLSREVPMSFNVVTCSWVKTENGWEPAAGSPCASGNCIKQNPPDTRCLFATVAPHVPAHLPTPIPAYVAFAFDRPLAPPSPHESPPPYPGFASTVLRM